MANTVRIPKFKSEKEEAQWWDAHPEMMTKLFLEAKREGKLRRLPPARGATKSVTIRLAVNDVEAAQALADKRGVPYQTFIKMLLHQALEKERLAS